MRSGRPTAVTRSEPVAQGRWQPLKASLSAVSVTAAESNPGPDPRPLTGGAVMAAGSRVAVAVTGAVTTIVIARLLGADGAGGYAVAQNLVLLLTIAGTLGLPQGIAYYVSSGAWGATAACRTGLRAAVATGIVCASVAVGSALAVPTAFAGLPLWAVAAVAAALPFALISLHVSFVALAIDRYEAYVLPPALQSTLALTLAVPGAVAFGVEGAVVAMAVSFMLVAGGSLAWARARLPQARGSEPAGIRRRALSFGLKGYGATALHQVNVRLDLFILSGFTTAAAVGHYAVAFAVTSVLWLLPQALAEVLFPRVARLSEHHGEDALAHREMVETKSLRHVTLAVTAGALVLALALLLLVVPVYGEGFRPAVVLGLILLPGVAAIGVSGVLSATITGRGKPIYSLYVVAVTSPVTLGLYWILIPSHEETGAAIASTISYTLTFLLCCVFYRKVTGRPVARSLLPTRDELHDLRSLSPAVRGWMRAVRERARGASRGGRTGMR